MGATLLRVHASINLSVHSLQIRVCQCHRHAAPLSRDYVSLFDREYLYKVGDTEYWLATSKPITKYFDKELKPGDKMTLYLISIGAYRIKDGIDCVLLVEEYQK